MTENARALAAFPGGISNGEFGLPSDLLPVMTRAEGCRLWDGDGQEYLDFSMGWGSCLVGHARPEVVEAVRRQAPRGSNFAYLNDQVLDLAEEVIRLSPAADQVRFCASGTEATMYCQRLARAATGKPKILKFEGAYHGANEAGVTSLFPEDPPDFPQPALTSAGTPAAGEFLLVAPFNDLPTTRALIEAHSHELAGVIIEPLQRCLSPRPGFLEGVRQACSDAGVLLIFDEVVTGFRLAYGGAQEYYRVTPDLVAYGKALGGGYPIGVFGGRADIMAWVEESRIGRGDYVWMASTLGGNPVSAAAANAALSVFRQPETYGRLHALGRTFREMLSDCLASKKVVGQVLGDGPLAQIVFSDRPVFDYRSGRTAGAARSRPVMLGLFRRRMFVNPMGTKLYLSLAHDEAACEAFCDSLSAVLDETD